MAALHRRVSPNAAQERRDVKPHRDADRRREIFLNLTQRRALLDACDGAILDLVEAAMLTAARAGELATARVSQFDARTGMMKYVGKTGTRTVPVSPMTHSLFKRLAKGKLPTAYLLTREDGLPWKHRKWANGIREAAYAAHGNEGARLRCAGVFIRGAGRITSCDDVRILASRRHPGAASLVIAVAGTRVSIQRYDSRHCPPGNE